ncbi:hypothetical protein HORIV_06760 [Vreelandella olivaria]|uniref:Alpha-D-phosphohexomutase alpha/beta/alpha domain-containing protein n=1 Tax=Vreelandella olivaria TaxID=390919 RepID=A0ABN5WP01_9GAMM|nr:hypothetical protein HORIV_06760 [Halomonas olivaria]
MISEAGGEPEMWRTGHSMIKARMQATGAQLGGEMSGHIFSKSAGTVLTMASMPLLGW